MSRVVRSGKRAGSTATAAKSTPKSGNRRSAEDVAKLVPAFRKHLQGGGTMKALKQEHGFSDDGPIRAALYRAGFDAKGTPHGVEENHLAGLSPAKLRDALVKLRSEGAAWYALAFQSDKTEAEVKEIVSEAGGPVGRVYSKTEKPAAEKPARSSQAKAGRARQSKTATAANPS